MIELTEIQAQALSMLAKNGDWVPVRFKNTERTIAVRTLEALGRRGLAEGGFPRGLQGEFMARATEAGLNRLAEMDDATKRAIDTAHLLFSDTKEP